MAELEAEQTGRVLRVGGLELDLDRAALSVDGRAVSLRPQSFDVLRVLVENRGRLVSKELLFREVWGSQAVTDDSISQCLGDIRRALNDQQKTIVRTVPRRGYILEADLLAPEGDGADLDSEPRARKLLVGAAVAALIAAVALLYGESSFRESAAILEPSIAVLPFTDRTEARDKRFLGEAIAEEILVALSRNPELRVVGRISSFSFSGTDDSLETIGSALDVTHVLLGSIRQGDDRLRISPQLVAVKDGHQVWAHSYDRPFGDILEIETHIARSVAEALSVEFRLAGRSEQSVDPYVHALVIEARSRLRAFYDGAPAEASAMLEQALSIDPDYVPALLAQSLTLYNLYPRGSEEGLSAEQRSVALVERALQLEPNNPVAHAYRGWLEMHHFKNFAQAARYYERATELDPYDPEVMRSTINASVVLNRPEVGVRLGQFLVERDPLCEVCYTHLSLAARVSGNHEVAIWAMRKVLDFNPNSLYGRQNLGHALLRNGEPTAALEELDLQKKETAETHRLMALAHHQLGNMDAFAYHRETLIERYGDTDHLLVAYVEAVRGDADSAFEWLQKNAEQPKWRRGLGGFKQPEFEYMRSDPRWNDYLQAMGRSPEVMDSINFDPTLPF